MFHLAYEQINDEWNEQRGKEAMKMDFLMVTTATAPYEELSIKAGRKEREVKC